MKSSRLPASAVAVRPQLTSDLLTDLRTSISERYCPGKTELKGPAKRNAGGASTAMQFSISDVWHSPAQSMVLTVQTINLLQKVSGPLEFGTAAPAVIARLKPGWQLS